jgi:aryl-alcohol dehydrogenase-like predicted oxidoreductase
VAGKGSIPQCKRGAYQQGARRFAAPFKDQLHRSVSGSLVEETANAMRRLYESGKIRAIGVSNFSPEQMGAFRAVAPLHSNQPTYNLFERQIEKDVLTYTYRNHYSTLAYGALCCAAVC